MTVIWKMRWVCPYFPRTGNFWIQKLCEVICHAFPATLVSHICVKFAGGDIVKCFCSDLVIWQFCHWVVLTSNCQKNVWDFHSRSYFSSTLAVGRNIIFRNSTLGKDVLAVLGWGTCRCQEGEVGKILKFISYNSLFVCSPPPKKKIIISSI